MVLPPSFSDPTVLILCCGIAALALLQLALALYVFVMTQRAAKDRARLHQEMFGLLKKTEGLLAGKREQILREYDKLLEQLSQRLPATIAAQASTCIFETESKILSRLAELEPALKKEDLSSGRMDELIKSMEKLEETLVRSAADTVERVLVESRSGLFRDSLEQRFAED